MDETGSFCPDTEVITAGHGLFSQAGRDGVRVAGRRGWRAQPVDAAPGRAALGTGPEPMAPAATAVGSA